MEKRLEGQEKAAGKEKQYNTETVTERARQRLKEITGKEEYKMPDGIGGRMWNIALKLLADQEKVEIRYDLIVCEDKQERAGTT